jgi:tripartite-type tricarboxylate transporter receptor subunit TctC
VPASLVQNPALRANLGYDPLKDFTLLGVEVTNPGVVFVGNELPVHDIKELVAYAKANPGKLNYARLASAPRATWRPRPS